MHRPYSMRQHSGRYDARDVLIVEAEVTCIVTVATTVSSLLLPFRATNLCANSCLLTLILQIIALLHLPLAPRLHILGTHEGARVRGPKSFAKKNEEDSKGGKTSEFFRLNIHNRNQLRIYLPRVLRTLHRHKQKSKNNLTPGSVSRLLNGLNARLKHCNGYGKIQISSVMNFNAFKLPAGLRLLMCKNAAMVETKISGRE